MFSHHWVHYDLFKDGLFGYHGGGVQECAVCHAYRHCDLELPGGKPNWQGAPITCDPSDLDLVRYLMES